MAFSKQWTFLNWIVGRCFGCWMCLTFTFMMHASEMKKVAPGCPKLKVDSLMHKSTAGLAWFHDSLWNPKTQNTWLPLSFNFWKVCVDLAWTTFSSWSRLWCNLMHKHSIASEYTYGENRTHGLWIQSQHSYAWAKGESVACMKVW